MSQHSDSIKDKAIKSTQNLNSDSLMIIRIIAAAVLFAVTLIIDMSSIITFILRVLAVAVAAYDLAFKAVEAVEKKDYFSQYTILLFVTVISFAIGFSWEGTALIILYQAGLYVVDYVIKRTKLSAAELMKYQDENIIEKMNSLIDEDDAGKMQIEDIIKNSAALVLKGAAVFAILFAVFLPIFTSFSYAESIHRALMIIVVSTPISLVVAMPLTGIIGMCFGAKQGIIFKNAAIIEKTADVKTAVFDKTGIFTEDTPHLISAESDVLANNTFMTFAAHSVYYSEQPMAKAIANEFSGDYKLEVISDFKDIPGLGVELSIGGSRVVLAKQEYFIAKGISVPETKDDELQHFFMYVGDRFVGTISLSNDFNEDCAELSTAMKDAGIAKTVLLTEDGKNESEDAATELGFDAFYSQCTPAKKKDVISDISERSEAPVMYIYASGIESHSDAKVDIRVARKGKYADALVVPQSVANLPMTVSISRRVKEVAVENAVFAFIIKAIVIFLAINGICTIWFALFMDFAAAIATVLNSIRVTSNSLLDKIRSGREQE